MPNLILEDKLVAALDSNIKPIIYEELISTNLTAKEMAANNCDEGLLIIAQSQTGGRGRLGRSFYSPGGSGIYFSLVLRPNLSPNDCILITSAAAVAVAEGVEHFIGKNAGIKWVNDIFVDNKKVCGILSEAAFNNNNQIDYVILGIGINICPPPFGFPKDIENIAGAIAKNPDDISVDDLIAYIINRFMRYYSNIAKCEFLNEYRQRLILKNKKVSYNINGVTECGMVLDVDERFRLKIRKDDGCVTHLSSGEVTIGSNNIQ